MTRRLPYRLVAQAPQDCPENCPECGGPMNLVPGTMMAGPIDAGYEIYCMDCGSIYMVHCTRRGRQEPYEFSFMALDLDYEIPITRAKREEAVADA